MAATVMRRDSIARAVPHRGNVQGHAHARATLLECGTDEQRRAYIAPTLTGEMRWCQGYSEPGAGSDLASLQVGAPSSSATSG
jgi:alkylation response protein AidB-like acyl-CoA dehydrogenase